jgi:phosphohistidine phosphatase
MTNRLYLLRHAKSDWDDERLDDHDRPLSPRGERAALVIGEYLRQQAVRFDRVLCSSARRAVETWSLVRQRLGRPPSAAITRELYLCGAGTLLAQAQATDAKVRALLLIGHNPDMQRLALMLAGGQAGALTAEQARFPTAALACIEHPGAWADLSDGRARLAWLVTPKTLV